MIKRHTIRRYKLGGVNRSADTDAENSGALRCENLLPAFSGGLRGREGWKVNCRVGGQYVTGGVTGMAQAHIPDLQSATLPRQNEILIASCTTANNNSGGLFRARKYDTTITNASASVSYYVSMMVVAGVTAGTNQWKFIVEDSTLTTVLASISLGSPTNSTLTVAQLATALNSAVANLSMATDIDTSPASTLPPVYRMPIAVSATVSIPQVVIGNAADITDRLVSEGPAVSQSLLDHACRLSEFGPSTRFSGVQFQNRLWFRDVYRLRKYDGKNAWFAGVKAPSGISTSTSTTGGVLPDGTWQYLVTFSIKDAQGYEVESEPFITPTQTVASGTGTNTITLSNIPGKGGWVPDYAGMTNLETDGWGAVCNPGVGSPVTTVTCSALLKLDAGDPVYLLNRTTGAYEERYVVSTTATTVTLNAAVEMSTADAMSPVRINIYRTKIGPSSLFYFLLSVPANITSTTQTYIDGRADSSLGAAYQEPLVAHTPPPGRINDEDPALEYESGSLPLELYRRSLVMGGIQGDGGACAFSDLENPEYWPEENRFRPGEGTEDVSGLKACQDFLMVYTRNSTYQVTGELTTGDFRVVPLGVGIGCASHDSIADCGGTVYWCADSGIYRSSGDAPEEISGPIRYLFSRTLSPDAINTTRHRPERSTGCYDSINKQYWLFLPSVTPKPVSGKPWATAGLSGWGWSYSEDSSVPLCLVFDIRTSQWFYLTQVDFSLGMEFFESELYGLSLGYYPDTASDRIIQLTQRINRTDRFASIDDALSTSTTAPVTIPANYVSRYDSLGSPGTLKKALRMRIEALNDTEPTYWNADVRGYKDYAPISTTTATNYYTRKNPIAFTGGIKEHKWRLLAKKLRSFSFELLGLGGAGVPNAVYERPTLTGVEVEFAEAYKETFKEPNG